MNRLVLTAVGGALDDTVSLDVGSEGSPGVDDVVIAVEAAPINNADALGLASCDVLGFSLGGMVAQQMAQDRPSIVHRMILVGTAPRSGEDIIHLEKPSLAKHLGDPTLKGYAVLQKISPFGPF